MWDGIWYSGSAAGAGAGVTANLMLEEPLMISGAERIGADGEGTPRMITQWDGAALTRSCPPHSRREGISTPRGTPHPLCITHSLASGGRILAATDSTRSQTATRRPPAAAIDTRSQTATRRRLPAPPPPPLRERPVTIPPPPPSPEVHARGQTMR